MDGDYKGMEDAHQFESFGLEDDGDFDQIMEDPRAAETELDARDELDYIACDRNICLYEQELEYQS